MEPKDEEEDPDTICYSRLMRKLNNIKLKAPDEYSEDALNNSYNVDVSSVSSVDEEPEVEGEEVEQPVVKKKKPKKPKKKNVRQLMAAMFGKPQDDATVKAKKAKKSVMNVYCTDYEVVKKAAKLYNGFRLKERKEDHEGAIVKGVGGQKLSEDWDVTWHDLGITADFFQKMQPFQKVNQFPGIYSITRKNNLARNLMKMKKAYPEQFRFFPRTYILPGEASEFRNQFTDRNGRPINRRKTYIVKPDNLAQGRGIYLSRNCEKIIESCTNQGGGWVVQDYLASPHLIEDLKYDLRIYVLLYGLNPLRIYIHEQGLARFATEPYEKPRPANLDNMFVHLTNYAINKMNDNFKQNNKQAKEEDEYGDYDEEDSGDYGDEEEGHKRSLFAILKILYSQGADPDKVMGEIKDIVIKTIMSGQPYMYHTYRVCQPECMDNSMCFQVLGFDIMIDKNFRPWLIEVNQSPSFATDSPLDYEVKKAVLKDTFALLNVSQERRENYIKHKAEAAAERMLKGKTIKLGNEEREARKQALLEERFEFERTRINELGSGFELIYPPLGDDDLEAEYEAMLQKAQDIWDEFTTGKGKKRMDEAKALEQAKNEKRKSQMELDAMVPHAQDFSDSDSDKSQNAKPADEIVAGTEELLAQNEDSPRAFVLESHNATIDSTNNAQESQSTQINQSHDKRDQFDHKTIEPVQTKTREQNQIKPVMQIHPTSPISQQKQFTKHTIQKQEVNGSKMKQQDRNDSTLDQLCERLDLENVNRAVTGEAGIHIGLEHLQTMAENHQATDKLIRAAQRLQLEQMQGKGQNYLGSKKNSKFGDMIQMIKMAQAREGINAQILQVAHNQQQIQKQSPLRSFQHIVSNQKAYPNHIGISPVKISKKQLNQPQQTQNGFKGQNAQNQTLLLSAIRGDQSIESKNYFQNQNNLMADSNFSSLQHTEESERTVTLPNQTPNMPQRTVKRGALTGTSSVMPSPQQNKMQSGFEMVASAAYAQFGNQNDLPFPGLGQSMADKQNTNSPQVGMNIKTVSGQQASPMDQFTISRLQGLQSKTNNTQIFKGEPSKNQMQGRASPSAKTYHVNIGASGGQIFLQGHRKVQHQPDNQAQQINKRGSPSVNKGNVKESTFSQAAAEYEDSLRGRKVSTQPSSHNQLPKPNSNHNVDAIIIRPDRIHFQDQKIDPEASLITKNSRTVASKYSKETPQKSKGHTKSVIPNSLYPHVQDFESWQGQQSLDQGLDYGKRAQNIKLMKSDGKNNQIYSNVGIDHLGLTPDGKQHYSYKLTLFNKAGQQSVSASKEGMPYESSNQTRQEMPSANIQSKTNSTAHSERFRIAQLRDSRRGSLYANSGQPSNHVPFALGSSFQAAGQQALFGNIGGSQIPQNRGETLPLHRNSIGPGVVAEKEFQINETPPKLDNEGNNFYPEPLTANNRKIIQQQFATPQQRGSEKLSGPPQNFNALASTGLSPAKNSQNPYDSSFNGQNTEISKLIRNSSSSRKQLLVPVLSNNSTSLQNSQTADSQIHQNSFSEQQPSSNQGYRRQKHVSNAIIQQANQIIQQVTRNGNQYHNESLPLANNGKAILGAPEFNNNRRSPQEIMSPSFGENINQVTFEQDIRQMQAPQMGASYHQKHHSLLAVDESPGLNSRKVSRPRNIDASPQSLTSVRLQERAQRAGISPNPTGQPVLQTSPKAGRGSRAPNVHESYELISKEDRVHNSVHQGNNVMLNILSQGPGHNMASQIQNQTQTAARRQLINKHTNINFANF